MDEEYQDLGEKIASFEKKIKKEDEKKTSSLEGVGISVRILSDFAGITLVCWGVGLFLDEIFRSKPTFTTTFLFLGFLTSLWTVFKYIQSLEKRQELEDKEDE